MRGLWFVLIGAAAFALAASAAPTAKLRVYEKDGATMVPFRFVAEWMGAKVGFDAASGNVTMTMADRTVAFKTGSKSAKVNDKALTAGLAPVARDGVTYVPVRFIAEALGAGVVWDNTWHEVAITHPAVPTPLLLHQTDADACWSTGIHLAAYTNSPSLIQHYLDAGELVDELDSDGYTPLVVAVLATRAQAAQLLLDKGAAIDVETGGKALQSFFAPSFDKGRLFEWACIGGDRGMKRAQLNMASRNAPPAGTPPVSPDAAAIVTAMVARGADVNVSYGRGTPLLYAAAAGDLPIARVLIDKGADPKAKAAGDCTVLHVAALFGALDVARLLLDKGADINARDQMRTTPLSMAMAGQHDAMIAMLTEKGATQ